jgi:DNA-binding transcriptional MerR regulator
MADPVERKAAVLPDGTAGSGDRASEVEDRAGRPRANGGSKEQSGSPPGIGGSGGLKERSGSPPGIKAGTGRDRTMSIGEVMALLKPEFPDITVSKIRFLEGAGLVHPRRSASGYRKFSEDDVARLRFVLRAQRDQYLPLRVIRERLADLEAAGEQPPARPAPDSRLEQPTAAAAPRHLPEAAPPTQPAPARGLLSGGPSDAQFSREELCRAAGTTVDRLAELEEFGLIRARGTGERGSWYDGEDLVVLRLSRELGDYGLEPRHLRMYKIFAEREAALFEQVVAPLVRQRNPESRSRARETLEALAELGSRLRDAALREAVSGFAEATAKPYR